MIVLFKRSVHEVISLKSLLEVFKDQNKIGAFDQTHLKSKLSFVRPAIMDWKIAIV